MRDRESGGLGKREALGKPGIDPSFCGGPVDNQFSDHAARSQACFTHLVVAELGQDIVGVTAERRGRFGRRRAVCRAYRGGRPGGTRRPWGARGPGSWPDLAKFFRQVTASGGEGMVALA